MEAFEKIQLAFKCPKALDDLQPCQNNWYCDGCQKMVYDFRGFSEEAILETFAQSGQKLCGIYDAERMKISPQTAKWYRWVPAAVMALGVTVLNSCGWGQKSNQHTVGEIKVEKSNYLMGVPLPQKVSDTTVGKVKINQRNHKKDKEFKADSSMSYLMGDVEMEDIDISSDVDTKPEYIGSDTAFNHYMAQNIKFEGDVTGRAIAQFVVEKNGSLTEIKIVRGISTDIDEQVISALKRNKKWQPAILNNKPVRSRLVMPVIVVPKE